MLKYYALVVNYENGPTHTLGLYEQKDKNEAEAFALLINKRVPTADAHVEEREA